MAAPLEATLWIGGVVKILQVPPDTGRILSGEWRSDATISSNNRVRVTSVGETARVYIESRDTNEVFAVCSIPHGKRSVYVLNAIDSSRNFKVRIEDLESGQHAFVGLSFDDRGHAFDFNVALSDHERQVENGRTPMQQRKKEGGPNEPVPPPRDMSLHDGQTIRVALKASTKAKLGSTLPTGMFALPLPGPPSPSPRVSSAQPAWTKTAVAPPMLSVPSMEAPAETDPFAAEIDPFAALASAPSTPATPSVADWTTF